MTEQTTPTFRDLALAEPLIKVLDEVGYETPTPIQSRIIPLMMAGRDVIGQAQTGTGKTAAFALPLLSLIDVQKLETQALVLAPTRELAIQVAEAIQKYATHLPGFHVLPIYGGQEYGGQLRSLRRGAQVVVGTPGRVMDHIERGTLKLDSLRVLVLDEADEMLRMGFVESVEWVLARMPAVRQIALFSATMPDQIRRLAQTYLKNPAEVAIEVRAAATTIRQRYWAVSNLHKLDALTRLLEVEEFEAMIIFVRTKEETVELASKLEARGFAATAINGDITQKMRERSIEQLKNGELDILVATDVAARGLDVERVSHVINYDIPYDPESYVHRIGRTGRAGRSGDAILFVTPREERMFRTIERATRQKIMPFEMPTIEAVNDQRITKFKQRIATALGSGDLDPFLQIVTQYEQEHNVPAAEIAAALGKLFQGDVPLLLAPELERRHQPFRPERDERAPAGKRAYDDRPERGNFRDRPARDDSDRGGRAPFGRSSDEVVEKGMERYRVAVGHVHGIKPGHLVGAIANESGIEGRHIGKVRINDDFSTVDLPEGMPERIFKLLQRVRVAGQPLGLTREEGSHSGGGGGGDFKRKRDFGGKEKKRF